MGDPKELIGYCKESPLEVLQGVFQTHAIHHYKDLYRPVDFRANISGLEIVESGPPAGTSITGTIKDLDLSRGEEEFSSPRTKQIYCQSLELAIEWHLNGLGEELNYLDIRNQKRKKHLEVYVRQLLEVAQITLGIKNPTVKDLKQVLREETKI